MLAAAAAGPQAAPARAGPPPVAGQSAPALLARSFDGRVLDVNGLHGKVVVLNFWASWCGPCRSEMPLLDALAREYRDRAVVVVGLSADDRHDRKDAVAAAKAVTYFTGLLSEAPANGFGAPQVLPLTYIITPTGRISAVLSANRGSPSAERLRAAIDAAMTPSP
ncbi:MAG: TlpA family protein disulfide reductase [Gammaproteobacteria bacterium]|nr:TlpA family protein disulfide reductase [Gammaproteobacteria bacterium]